MKTEQIKEASISRFLKNTRKTAFVFHQLLKKESRNSVFIAENELGLWGAVSESVRLLSRVRRLPVLEDGMPYLYRFAKNFLDKNQETISEKTLRNALYKTENGRGRLFYDAELFLLSHFLVLAGAELYIREKSEKYLHDVRAVCEMDFSEIFFSFST